MPTNKQLLTEFLKAVESLEESDRSKAAEFRNGLVRKTTALNVAHTIKKEDLQLKRAQASEKERRGYDKQIKDLEATLEADKATAYRDWTKKVKDALP